jgi:hypothetical protein
MQGSRRARGLVGFIRVLLLPVLGAGGGYLAFKILGELPIWRRPMARWAESGAIVALFVSISVLSSRRRRIADSIKTRAGR